MRSNSLAWSPTFPTTILLASEDHNLYTFDIRALRNPTQIYKAHVAAVMACDWSPTGTELVSGSWDRTVRIWRTGSGSQPEVYHTKRMQRVTATLYTADARFVLSGSDDGNVRVWKARAAEKLGVVTARERAAMEYRESLKQRWKMDTEVGKVQRYVVSAPAVFGWLTRAAVGAGTSRGPCTRRRSSSVPCWRRVVSRTSTGGSIHALGRTSHKRRGRRL